ncbi:hypothetical protein J3R82DRAFT_2519 [Butyriboletus roseoflavus]|nr:hypothetical protein J3R82DRAFT_2519 [Butyriboletus roseoflavus]
MSANSAETLFSQPISGMSPSDSSLPMGASSKRIGSTLDVIQSIWNPILVGFAPSAEYTVEIGGGLGNSDQSPCSTIARLDNGNCIMSASINFALVSHERKQSTKAAQDGQYLFKVHKSILSAKSEMFEDMFRAQHEAGIIALDGQTEITPILLPATVGETAFELFLCVCYGRYVYLAQIVIRTHKNLLCCKGGVQTTKRHQIMWCSNCLKLSHMFMSNDAREVAINEINNRHVSIRPCRLISLSIEYKVNQLFMYGFKRLIKARMDDLTDDEHDMLCPRLWATILKAQSTLRVHRRIVACELPPINHVANCMDTEGCSLDWQQLWWNGMGRSLLDGRNLQPYKDAVQRFEQILLTNKVRRIFLECLCSVMATIQEEAAFNQEDAFIDRAAQKWAAQLLTRSPYLS